MEAQPAKIGKKKYFESELVAYLSASGEPLVSEHGRISVYVARNYGFCHGVIRAIRMALDSSEKYAGRRIFLLGEMIHNTYVNDQLRRRGVVILDIPWQERLASLTPEDVVILPAFGVSVETKRQLQAIGCTVIDTTCGEVMSVWKRIGRYNEADFTTIIHGKVGHEETIATSSYANRYLMVKDPAEAQIVADYIRGSDDDGDNADKTQALLARFAGAYSEGFDPAHDLQKVGMAAQTTMYASEFLRVSATIHDAVSARYGEAAGEHFQELDTICSATQERQDAIDDLARRSDVVIVAGGYNSSNTTNLNKVAHLYTRSFHIQGTGQINCHSIRHLPYGKKVEEVTENWLPAKPKLAIALTSGASMPDSLVEDILHELVALDCP